MTVKWGVLGCSGIGASFAQALSTLPDAHIAGIASRDIGRAKAFAAALGAEKAFGNYNEMLADPAIDIVYIASAPTEHSEHAKAALSAGKPVLVEKPFALNARDAQEIVQLAESKSLFCMEAMWMRFNPLVQHLKQMSDTGELGAVRNLSISTGYPTHPEKSGSTDIGRGALLNFGVYGVSLAHFLFGKPSKISGKLERMSGVVDNGFVAHLDYGAYSAQISGAIDAQYGNVAELSGTGKRVLLGAPFFDPSALHIEPVAVPNPPLRAEGSNVQVPQKSKVQRIADALPFGRAIAGSGAISLMRGSKLIPVPAKTNGLALEAAAAMEALRTGATQNEIMPLKETVEVLETLDAIRGS